MNQITENQDKSKAETVYSRRSALKRMAALGLMAAAPSTLIISLRPVFGASDLTDTWNATETYGGETICYTCSIYQSGQILTVKTPYGEFSGTISGNTASWTGTYTDPKTNETVTLTSMNLQLSGDRNMLNGTYSWTRNSGSSGTTSILIVRQPAGLPDGYSSAYGSCYSSKYYSGGTYSYYRSSFSYPSVYYYGSYGSIYHSGGYTSTYMSGSTC